MWGNCFSGILLYAYCQFLLSFFKLWFQPKTFPEAPDLFHLFFSLLALCILAFPYTEKVQAIHTLHSLNNHSLPFLQVSIIHLSLLTWKNKHLLHVQSHSSACFFAPPNLLRDLVLSGISSFTTPASSSSCPLSYKIYSTILSLDNLPLASVITPVTLSSYLLLLLFLKLLGRIDCIQQGHFCTMLL